MVGIKRLFFRRLWTSYLLLVDVRLWTFLWLDLIKQLTMVWIHKHSPKLFRKSPAVSVIQMRSWKLKIDINIVIYLITFLYSHSLSGIPPISANQMLISYNSSNKVKVNFRWVHIQIFYYPKNIWVAKEFCFRRLRNVVDNRCLLLSIHSALPSNAQKFLCLNWRMNFTA